ncbi:MAG: DNA replication complex GINS family protein [Candidatus Nezhaarchaeota archaeon]|nr:DNA replication complex GINS family protein [Candidatus Nezhaarchaeota archaeon]
MSGASVKRSALPLLIEEVKVEVTKPLPEILETRPLHMLPVGAMIEVPRWLASILEEEGYVKVLSDVSLDLQWLSKLSWREERSPSPVEVDEALYPKIRELLERLGREASTSIEAHTAKKQAEVKVLDIVRCRLQKIVQAAVSPSVPKGLLDNLTPEEKMLFEKLRWIVDGWTSKIRAG